MFTRLISLTALCICTLPAFAAEVPSEPPAGPPKRQIVSASQARREAFAPKPRGLPRATASNSALFSVCPDGTSTDYKNGSPTITITQGGTPTVSTAVLSVAQTGDIGVGMRIDYDSGGTPKKCWIASVRDSDIGDSADTFYVVTATGGVAPTCSGLSVDSIKHEFASLSAFEANFTDSDHINNADLIAGEADARVWACCYDGSSDDTDDVGVVFGDTDADHNLIIYTPFEDDEVVLESQRHAGTWTTNAYTLDISSGGRILDIEQAHTWVEGLQIEHGTSISGAVAIEITETGCRATSNIVRQTSAGSNGTGIYVNDADGEDFLLFNNIVYNFTNVGVGIVCADSADTGEMYSNTVYGCDVGCLAGGTDDVVVIDCLSYNNDSYDFFGGASSNSDYNFSKDDTAPGGNSIHGDTDGATPDFVSTTEGSEDLHIQITSDARDVGTTLGGDLDYDIDGDDRPIGTGWDIGADERLIIGTDYYYRMMEREL